MAYTWIPFYRELAPKILEYSPEELIGFLVNMGINGLVDYDSKKREFRFDDLDPFSFLSFLNKYGDERRIDYAGRIGELMNLRTPPPTDFHGVPNAEARSTKWFDYRDK